MQAQMVVVLLICLLEFSCEPIFLLLTALSISTLHQEMTRLYVKYILSLEVQM